MDAREQILDILSKAYQLEVDGYTFYSMTADRARTRPVQQLFDQLARDEQQHQVFLREVAGHYTSEGSNAFRIKQSVPDLRAFSEQVFTDRLRKEVEDATFEAGVLSVGITLETASIQHFMKAATSATDDTVRDFYQFLASWERQHLDALQNAYNAVREDFWARSGMHPSR